MCYIKKTISLKILVGSGYLVLFYSHQFWRMKEAIVVWADEFLEYSWELSPVVAT